MGETIILNFLDLGKSGWNYFYWFFEDVFDPLKVSFWGKPYSAHLCRVCWNHFLWLWADGGSSVLEPDNMSLLKCLDLESPKTELVRLTLGTLIPECISNKLSSYRQFRAIAILQRVLRSYNRARNSWVGSAIRVLIIVKFSLKG